MIADGLPAHGDAPPKYDNKISHYDLARLLYFVANLTLPRKDVKRFPDAATPFFNPSFAIVFLTRQVFLPGMRVCGSRSPIKRYPGNQALTDPAPQEAALATPSKEARERAEQKFRKKEIEARDASKAMAEYQAGLAAQREKTARLRALREAKQAAEAAARRIGQAPAVGDAESIRRKTTTPP